MIGAKRLLILSCSQRKQAASELLPALDRYDGPAFQIVRKYARQATLPPIWILSAEYGLISSKKLIPAYDKRMTRSRAGELKSQVTASLDALSEDDYRDVLVCAGQTYAEVLASAPERLDCPVKFATGTFGRQLATLRDWLYGAPPPPLQISSEEPVLFKGEELRLDGAEVLNLASRWVRDDPGGASRYAAWAVQVGEIKVAPKWLLSMITGVPVSDFRTADALRVLTALGIEVQRI